MLQCTYRWHRRHMDINLSPYVFTFLGLKWFVNLWDTGNWSKMICQPLGQGPGSRTQDPGPRTRYADLLHFPFLAHCKRNILIDTYLCRKARSESKPQNLCTLHNLFVKKHNSKCMYNCFKKFLLYLLLCTTWNRFLHQKRSYTNAD